MTKGHDIYLINGQWLYNTRRAKICCGRWGSAPPPAPRPTAEGRRGYVRYLNVQDDLRGDLAALLGEELASRLDEFIQRTKECSLGAEFDKDHPTPAAVRKRAGGTYGQALCAAEAVLSGVQAAGPWGPLSAINRAGLCFRFAGPALAAAKRFSEFAQTYAPLLMMFPEDIDQLVAWIYALAVDVVVENGPLGEKDRIKLVVCKDADQKDCEGLASIRGFINTVTPERQTILRFSSRLPNDAPELPSPEVQPSRLNQITKSPAEVFSSSNMNIHSHFCDGWSKNKQHLMIVNAAGANVVPDVFPGSRGLARFGRRTPPANPERYSGYTFGLGFTPSEKGGACKLDCNTAYPLFARACAASSPGVYTVMYSRGTVDVGCGSFSYQIHNPDVEVD
ncbi:hypothetical protein QBC34DRAFT_499237 [Podospora aff. communis PSN243]|uniref:Uncharacterized protein n=1 Tax=Podospora aff. communis PSN243 TaxID=3040156 RepID=A0AAV9G6V9_9PEZI|nr:hypothetical protein QBC34DRAFT_499237 [Podospora aff. communis PSN243]